MEIDSFDALLQAARSQPEPQRLLLVFVKTALPEDADEEQVQRFEAGEGGGLVPVMYVDKAADELGGFAELVRESEQMSEDWHMVLVGALDGRGGRPPTPEEAEEPLKNIVRAIHAGGDLGHLAAFDREGWPVRFM
ncbi:ribonucleotide reductase subunit alpha [Ectothiorhodospiraceae bacterium WFHF3C12]|nr:ribonucleotide reductase subunit alpha [Ectothiorhodospiraceae bacterium WFHF3C12]